MTDWKDLNEATGECGPFHIRIGEDGEVFETAYLIRNEELHEYIGNWDGGHRWRMPLGFFDTPETIYYKPLGRDPLPHEAVR